VKCVTKRFKKATPGIIWQRERTLREYGLQLVLIHDDESTPFAFDYGGKLNEDNGGRRRYQSGLL